MLADLRRCQRQLTEQVDRPNKASPWNYSELIQPLLFSVKQSRRRTLSNHCDGLGRTFRNLTDLDAAKRSVAKYNPHP